jgi:glycosyltransferase 2 family protein
MSTRWKSWWPVLKTVLAVAILAAVGWQFMRILQDPSLQAADPQHRPTPEIFRDTLFEARPFWLVASGIAYIVGLFFFLAYWVLLLGTLGQRPKPPAAVRAYFVGHLGKYVPGKAWALALRTLLIRGDGVRLGIAALTAAYETLTTMASGALIAAVLLTWEAGREGLVWRALGLLALAGIPILPGVFNRLVRRTVAPFLRADAEPLPPLRNRTLFVGLGMTAFGWVLFGVSLWAAVEAVRPDDVAWGPVPLTRCVAFVAVAYVAGFLALPAPGGLGVREFFLQQALEPELGPLLSVVVVLLLRLIWTVAEAFMAAVVWWLPGQPNTVPQPVPPVPSVP